MSQFRKRLVFRGQEKEQFAATSLQAVLVPYTLLSLQVSVAASTHQIDNNRCLLVRCGLAEIKCKIHLVLPFLYSPMKP